MATQGSQHEQQHANSATDIHSANYPQDPTHNVPVRDEFARAAIKQAHLHAKKALEEAKKAVEIAQKNVRTTAPTTTSARRCKLCGEPANRDYCHEHEWAAA